MKKVGLIFVLAFGLPMAGWSQGWIGKAIPRIKAYAAWPRSLYKTKITTNIVQPNPPIPTVSVEGYFHRLGNGETWNMPDYALEQHITRHVQNQVYKRSLESLQLEAQALGLHPLNLETYSRDELENFIHTYHALKSAQAVPGRPQAGERANALHRWTFSPTFVKENYIDESWNHDYIDYTVPFHPSVKTLRILVVRDSVSGMKELFDAAKKHPGVTIKWRMDIPSALEKLDKEQYDVVLADFILGDKTSFEIGMYVWNKKLGIPVICYSAEYIDPEALFRHNIVGQVPVVHEEAWGELLFNYLSNIVATGRAYPGP